MAKRGYFASRCKGRQPRWKIAAGEAIAGPGRLPQSPSEEGWARHAMFCGGLTASADPDCDRNPSSVRFQETLGILAPKLGAQARCQSFSAKSAQIAVEVIEPWFERHDLNPGGARPFG